MFESAQKDIFSVFDQNQQGSWCKMVWQLAGFHILQASKDNLGDELSEAQFADHSVMKVWLTQVLIHFMVIQCFFHNLPVAIVEFSQFH